MYEKDNERNRLITEIGLSVNIEYFRRECLELGRRGLSINLPDKTFVDEMIREAIKRIESNLPERYKGNMEILGYKGREREYFEKINKGRQESNQRRMRELRRIDEIIDVEKRLELSRARGNFKQEREQEIRLRSLEDPEGSLEGLEQAYKGAKGKDKEIYKKMIEDVTESLEGYKEKSEEEDFYDGVEYNLKDMVRFYLYEDSVGSESILKYVEDERGQDKLGYWEMEILKRVPNLGKEGEGIVESVRVYRAIEEYMYQEEEIKKRIRKGVIQTTMELNPDNFKVSRIEGYRLPYMRKIMQPEGYRCYRVRPTEVVSRCMYMSLEKVDESVGYVDLPRIYKEARAEIEGIEKGLKYKHMTRVEEERYLPYIMRGNHRESDGMLKEKLDLEYEIRGVRYTRDSVVMLENTDLYQRLVQPFTMDIIGSLIKRLRLSQGDAEDIEIYYISPEEICIGIKERVDEGYDKEILKVFGGVVKEERRLEIEDIIG